MKHIEKISIVVFVLAIAYLYYSKPKNTIDAYQSPADVQESAPWFLLYNYPVGFTGKANLIEPALPQRATGQIGQTGQECAVCQLFPTFNTTQY